MFRHRTKQIAPLPQGASLIAPNHASFLDPLLVAISMPESVIFFARESLFKGFLGIILRSANTYPIKRGERDLKAMKQILQFLKEGKKVVLFPEGTRSVGGELQPLQPGVAALAIKAGCPLIPIHIEGSFEAYPKGKWLPNPLVKTTCTLLPPLFPEKYEDLPKGKKEKALLNDLKEALTRVRGCLQSPDHTLQTPSYTKGKN